MSLCTWIGGTSKVFDLAANWDPAAIPSDGDTILFNDQAAQGMAGGAVAAKGFDIIVDEGFIYEIGASGTQFAPANACPSLLFAGKTILPCYFDATITRCTVATESAKDNLVNLDGTITDLAVEAGKVAIDAGATVNGRISIKGLGGMTSELTVPSGATLTDVEIAMDGGKFTTDASLTTCVVNAGELILSGTAAVTGWIQVYDGTVYWDSASTIALAQVYGGEFKTRKERANRILTTGISYGRGLFDFRVGGATITYTNPLVVNGEHMPLFPKGMKIAPTV